MTLANTDWKLQQCTGIRSGFEEAVHAAVDIFEDEKNHWILRIDTSNELNSINRAVALHNMNILYSELAIYVFNFYQTSLTLFTLGGKEIKSKVLIKESLLQWVCKLREGPLFLI